MDRGVVKRKHFSRHCSTNGFFGEILRLCTLHGVKYIGFQNHSIIDRVFWIVAVLSCFALACWNILNLYEKYLDNPIITTYQSQTTPIGQIPFPAITLCNVNILKRAAIQKAYDNIKKEMQKSKGSLNFSSPKTADAYVALEYLTQYCLAAPSFFRLIGDKLVDSNGTVDAVAELKDGLREIDELLEKASASVLSETQLSHFERVGKSFLHKASHGCSDMLIKCRWGSQFVRCRKIFHHTNTAHGVCCTFNMLPKYIMRMWPRNSSEAQQQKKHLELTDEEIFAWEEFGNGDLIRRLNSYRKYPVHQYSGGAKHGLTLLINPELDVYSTCTANDATGFKITPHSPISFPRVMDYGFAVPTGSEVYVEIEPQVTVADENDIRSISVRKRGCYFANDKEAQLPGFKFYTASNCMDECIAKWTYRNCSCVRVFMNKNATQRICYAKQLKCTEDVLVDLIGRGKKGGGDCSHCLPLCTEISYKSRVSQFPLRDDILEEFSLDEPLHHGHKRSANYSIVHIYMGSDSLYAKERKRLYAISDLLGNAGGLLGLTLGFSILALIEVVYFFTLKLCFRLRSHFKASSNSN